MSRDFQRAPVKYMADIQTGSGDTQDASDHGFPFYVRSERILYSADWEFEGDAVLTAGDGDIGKIFHRASGKFKAHQRVYVMNNFRHVTPDFFLYAFTSEFPKYILAGSAQSTVPSIRRHMIADLQVPLPPLPTQRRIADYLDRETAQIDAMAEALDGLVARLEERRRALIDNQFSEVFDATRTPIWSILEPRRRLNYPSEEVLSVYRDLGVVPKSSRDDNHNVTPQDVSVYQLVNRGDVVVNKMKAWQGSVSVSNFRGIVSSDYQVAAPTVPINSRYLHHVLRTSNMIRLYGIRSTGVRPSQWRLYWQDFSALSIPLPPLNEQGRIADHLDAETAKIDAMIAKAGGLRALLDERRSALITATVTGQHPVPEEH